MVIMDLGKEKVNLGGDGQYITRGHTGGTYYGQEGGGAGGGKG